MGSEMCIRDRAWIFHAPAMVVSPKRSQPGIRTTITSVTATHCWLLLADVVGSTQLLESVGPKEYATRLSQWMAELDAVIRSSAGFVNERLGDGLLAVWDAGKAEPDQVISAIHEIHALSHTHPTPFRALLHSGEILFGAGGYSSGLENLTGPALNFLFKSERALPERSPGLYLSETAREQQPPQTHLEHAGLVNIPGFSAEHFYRLEMGAKKGGGTE